MPDGALMTVDTFFIRLDVFDEFKMVVDNVENVLDCPVNSCKIPIVRKRGHLYLECNKGTDTFSTRPELKKIHRAFHHPSSKTLHDLLRRARPEKMNSETLNVLKEIAKKCDTC